MAPWMVGGIVGGIAAVIQVLRANRRVRRLPCPRCHQVLGWKRPGKSTMRARFWGRWTCPGCGCEIDRHGNEWRSTGTDGREHGSATPQQQGRGAPQQHETPHPNPCLQDWISTRHTSRDIIRRPQLLLLEPQLFVVKPWIVVIFFAVCGLVLGIAEGIRQGAGEGIGGMAEGILLLSFFSVVGACFAGGMLAGVFWLVRAVLRTISRAMQPPVGLPGTPHQGVLRRSSGGAEQGNRKAQ